MAFDADDERPDQFEDEHHANLPGPGYVSARKAFHDLFVLFADNIATVGQLSAHHDGNRIAKYLTELKFLRSCLA